jgi:hypothetical protein
MLIRLMPAAVHRTLEAAHWLGPLGGGVEQHSLSLNLNLNTSSSKETSNNPRDYPKGLMAHACVC